MSHFPPSPHSDCQTIRVVLLIPTLDRSGAEKQLTRLATGLPRDDFHPHVVALTRGGAYEATLRDAGIPLTILHKRWKFDPLALWKLKCLLDRLQPDILHTWLFAANAYGRMVAGKSERPRVIVSERCVDRWKRGWHYWIDRHQIARTSRLVGNSASVAEFYRQQGFPAQRLEVVPNGIELPEPLAVDRSAILETLGIPADSKVIGYIGRLARQKRIDDLIWAMELLRSLDDQIHFLIIGDGPERNRLTNFSRQIGAESRIHFLGHRDDVSRLLQSMDVFWLASDFEGQSNSLMEAMAAGIPVVASDIAPNRELVQDGWNGYLVQVGDRAKFAEVTYRLLCEPDRSRQIGQLGRERMRTEFSVQKMVDAYAELYRQVLKSPTS